MEDDKFDISAFEYVELVEKYKNNNIEEGWSEELETQFWSEQPPYPFATDVELEMIEKNGTRT